MEVEYGWLCDWTSHAVLLINKLVFDCSILFKPVWTHEVLFDSSILNFWSPACTDRFQWSDMKNRIWIIFLFSCCCQLICKQLQEALLNWIRKSNKFCATNHPMPRFVKMKDKVSQTITVSCFSFAWCIVKSFIIVRNQEVLRRSDRLLYKYGDWMCVGAKINFFFSSSCLLIFR